MKIWIVSDIHAEFAPWIPPDPLPDADVCVVAGDFAVGGLVGTLEWLNANIAPTMGVVVVAGNHDVYDTFHVTALSEAREQSARLERVHFLENDTVNIAGITFVGCTLWTDFLLTGARDLAMFEASTAMSDYRRINHSKKPFQRFNPLRSLRAHQQSLRFLDRALAGTERAVVISHHAPSPMSVPVPYRGHRLSPAYASDLHELILRHRPAVWIHGHIHEPVDYMLGGTRVVSDPRGYPGERVEERPPVVIEV